MCGQRVLDGSQLTQCHVAMHGSHQSVTRFPPVGHNRRRSSRGSEVFMVNVLYDDEIFSIQIQGGISRYFTELIEGLTAFPDVKVRLPFPLTCNQYAAESRRFPMYLFCGGRSVPGRRTLTRMINRRATAFALGRGKPDIVHATLYDETLLDRIEPAKLVITVHDMVPELMPEAVGGIEPAFRRAKQSLIAKAAGLVAISANTAADIARLTHRPIDTIKVIHHGVSERMRWNPQLSDPPALPERFLLCVGPRRAYKNFLGVAPAIVQVMQAEADLALVCFGGGPFTAEEQAVFETAGVGGRLIATGGDDRALAAAYAHAVALVYPSLYEGFGMPILEAMLNRCPVIVPKRSCFPEIAEDAAIYFDPTDLDGLVENLTLVLRDAALRRHLGEAGVCRAAAFNWQHCAAEHASLYRSLAE
jgi:glycosyltransferase involved in cell wall biosynthesis